MATQRRSCLLLLALALVLGPATKACSDDSNPPPGDGAGAADQAVPGGEARAEAAQPCLEGQKFCPNLEQLKVCQGGKWVDLADCSTKKSASGYLCTCSVTLGACQYGGTVCP
jgi:hypothetical protein